MVYTPAFLMLYVHPLMPFWLKRYLQHDIVSMHGLAWHFNLTVGRVCLSRESNRGHGTVCAETQVLVNDRPRRSQFAGGVLGWEDIW